MEDLMRVAALYDIHGNLQALDAVLVDVRREAPDVVLIGGDCVLGPQPEGCLARIRDLGSRGRLIRGNTDREVAAPVQVDAPSRPWAGVMRWVAERLSDEDRALLAGLPTTLAFDVDGLGPTLFCHGSPHSDDEIMTKFTDEVRSREITAGVKEGVIVCGHTHVQFDRLVAGKRIVNAGSVGMPYEKVHGAYWAMFGPQVSLRRTGYDLEGAASAIRASGFPNAEAFVQGTLLAAHDPDAVSRTFEERAGRAGSKPPPSG
jgi:predicted phosphodiesterase